jgi:hypothetical protein
VAQGRSFGQRFQTATSSFRRCGPISNPALVRSKIIVWTSQTTQAITEVGDRAQLAPRAYLCAVARSESLAVFTLVFEWFREPRVSPEANVYSPFWSSSNSGENRHCFAAYHTQGRCCCLECTSHVGKSRQRVGVDRPRRILNSGLYRKA